MLLQKPIIIARGSERVKPAFMATLVDWVFHEVKQRTSRLVLGWVTAMLHFVEDPTNATFSNSGGMRDDTTTISKSR